MADRPPVSLRDLIVSDWTDVHAYASRPEVCRFQPWGPNTPEESRAFVEAAVADNARLPRTRFALAVVLAGATDIVGAADLNVRSAEFRTGEIGYVLNPVVWGRGIGTEVARQLLRLGFERLNLHRIYATCDPKNLASARVLQKAGLTYEGRLRQNYLIRDGWRDSDLYAILEGEWRAEEQRGRPADGISRGSGSASE